MTGSFDILIVGIGGQGTILASNILGEACLIEGRHVKGAETHGMAQRGGSVESHIRIDGMYGPLIPPVRQIFSSPSTFWKRSGTRTS